MVLFNLIINWIFRVEEQVDIILKDRTMMIYRISRLEYLKDKHDS